MEYKRLGHVKENRLVGKDSQLTKLGAGRKKVGGGRVCSCSPKKWGTLVSTRRYMRYFILNRCWSWNLPPWTRDADPGSLWDTEGAQRLSYLLGVLKQAPGVCQVSSIYNQHRGHPSLLTSKLETSCGQWRYLWVFRSSTHGAQGAYVCKARMWTKS